MTRIIDKKIIDCEVIKPQQGDTPDTPGEEKSEAEIIHMHEKVDRPELLLGATYKIKTPLSDHALYVTINDIVLNPGTDHELRRPFEIFINSKNMDHFQWVVALTRVISAVFRKGGDCTFLVDELKAVFDPQGGYFKTGGKFMPSLVAEIGYAIESHLHMIGLLKPDELSAHQKAILEQKRAEYDAAAGNKGKADDTYPNGAKLCKKCHTVAVVLLDGCMTCLSCGDSKCG